MDRRQIRDRLINAELFPFWVPVITHYRAEPGLPVDAGRMARHARQIAPHTRLWMVGGTTGDGWNLTDAQYDGLLEYACSVGQAEPRPSIVLGALRPTTAGVIALIERIKRRIGLPEGSELDEGIARMKDYGMAAITICAPVGAGLSQEAIERHLGQVCEAAGLPIVIYQLPQVTHNLISIGVLARLLERFPQIILFKDSGGGDEIANSGQVDPALLLVRGAEGGYLEALKLRGGPYDGWLLSTGNAFAPQLAEIAALGQQGKFEAAQEASRRLTGVVERIFALAQELPSGNPFSNANRAADHLLAYSAAWPAQPLPLLQDGRRLPAEFLHEVALVLRAAGWLPEHGYMLD